ncbi:MAG: methyl-accepting chemotaxis protein [Betaproteobacteria bacterium]|nr:methyl-accepting chemotaxis protein [Betaproteobacteria bacterium]
MKRYLRFVARHPYLLVALIVVFFLPWVWMAFLVPAWALLTSLALVPLAAFAGLALVVRDMTAEEEEEPPDAGSEPFIKWRKRTRLFQQVVIGLDTMLERWDAAAEINRRKLEMVTESVEDVIRLTESAVTEISKSFRVVVARANEQTEAVMSLLKGEGESGASGILSLPEFIKAYDSQLLNVTSHMTSFSQAADEMASHQKRITEHARVMEETIDGLRNMAAQISRIALDGSVAMTSQTFTSQDFVEITDRIRGISAEAHDLTRKTRQGLDAIGDEVRQGNRRTTQVAEAARRAVGVARAEISSLNAATTEQTRKIESTLQRINALSVEIQRDINQIIVAMQFQDITRQKLERLHKPALGAAADSLSLLSHETRALLQRDLYRAVRAYSESALKPQFEDSKGEQARRLDEADQPAEADGTRPPDKRVEIF